MVSKDFIEKLKGILGEAEKVLEQSHAEARQSRREAHQFKDNHRANWHQAETNAYLALTSVRFTKMILEGISEFDK